MIDLSTKRNVEDDEWLAVKADVFKNDPNPRSSSSASFTTSFKKRRPNFHVNWNENEQKFCVTFNENSRVKSDTKQKCSFSSSFSVDQLIYVHRNLAYLIPELADDDGKCGDATKKFYDFFPEYPRSTWSEYFLTKVVAKPTEISDWRSYIYYFARANCPTNLMDKLCLKLENYFTYAYQKCSHFAFMSTLFPENFGVDEYFENLSELRHKTYAENLEKSTANFRFLIENRRKTVLSKSSKNLDSNFMNEKMFFDELDSSMEEILNLLAEYYTYLREPFLDLREIARAQMDLWKRTLEEDFDVGDRVKLSAKEKLTAKRQEYKDCVENLQELQLQYYAETKKLLSEYLNALKAEKIRFRLKAASRSFDPSVAHFLSAKVFDLEKRVAFADVNLCACHLWPIRQKRKAILNKITRLDVSSPNLHNVFKDLEREFIDAQKEYYSTEIRILSAQDKYIRFQLNEIRRITSISPKTGETDEDGDTFYDAPDSEREIIKFLDKYSCDQPKILTLKCQMDTVNRQLAILRNKKKKFEEKINEGNGAILSSLTPDAAAFGNCDLKSLLENENNRTIYHSTEKLKLDRKTTIERIRSYRAKNNLKPTKNPVPKSKTQTKMETSKMSKFSSKPRVVHEAKVDVPLPSKLAVKLNVESSPPPPPPPPLPLNFSLAVQNFNAKSLSSAGSVDNSSEKSTPVKTSVVSKMDNSNNMDSIVTAIKSGSIRLKKVEQQRPNRKSSALEDDSSPSGRLLAEMMSKIRNMAHLSSDDEDSDGGLNDDFDSS